MKNLPYQKPWSSGSIPEDLAVWIAEEVKMLGLETADIFKICLPETKSSIPNKVHTSTDPFTNGLDDEIHPIMKLNNWDDLGEIISRDDLFSKPNSEILEESETNTSILEDEPKTSEISHKANSSVLYTMKKKKRKKKEVNQSKEQEQVRSESVENDANDTSTISKNGLIQNNKNNKKTKVKNDDLIESSAQISAMKIRKDSNECDILIEDKITHKALKKKNLKKQLKRLKEKVTIIAEPVLPIKALNLLQKPLKKVPVETSMSSNGKGKRKLSVTHTNGEDIFHASKKKKSKTNLPVKSTGMVNNVSDKLKKKYGTKQKKVFNMFNVEIID